MRARQGDLFLRRGRLTGGFGAAFYPYEVSLGVTVRWGFMPSLRLHIGPFKVWAGCRLAATEGGQA